VPTTSTSVQHRAPIGYALLLPLYPPKKHFCQISTAVTVSALIVHKNA
jgi:hypothetical protein